MYFEDFVCISVTLTVGFFVLIDNIHEVTADGIPITITPKELLVNPSTNKLYVTGVEPKVIVVNLDEDTISEIDGISKPIDAMTLDPFQNRVYMTPSNTQEILVLDSENDKILDEATIKLTTVPKDIAFSHGSNMFLNVIYEGTDNGQIIFTDLIGTPSNRTRNISPNTDMKNYELIKIISDRNESYLLSESNVYRMSNDISNQAPIPVINSSNLRLIDINIDPEKNLLYVTFLNSSNYAFIHNISLAEVNQFDEDIEMSSIPLGKGFIPYIFLDRANNKPYVYSYSGDFFVIDNKNEGVKPYDLVDGNLLSVDSDGEEIYLLEKDRASGRGSIHIIDPNDNFEPLYGLRFSIDSPNPLGNLRCEIGSIKSEFIAESMTYKRFDNGTELECYHDRLAFEGIALWNISVQDLNGGRWEIEEIDMNDIYHWLFGASDSKLERVKFTLSEHGNLNATFVSSVPISHKYGIPFSTFSLAFLSLGAAIFSIKRIRESKTITRIFPSSQHLKGLIGLSDLITIDSAIIAGILILLSFGGRSSSESEQELSQVSFLTITVIFPLVISVIAALRAKIELSISYALAGFVQLGIVMVLLLMIVFSDQLRV